MSITIEEALKRVRSHANVTGAGVLTHGGRLIAAVGAFDSRDAARCARFAAVAARAVDDADELDAPSDDERSRDEGRAVELARVRTNSRELVLTRCSNVILAVFLAVD